MTHNSIATLLKTTRQYFWNLDFDEVEIPYLNSSLPLEPNLYSFSTIWSHSHEKLYLPTSPEFALKNHLASTKKNCFAIAHCFRDLETGGPHHTKEFLMLEWYEIGKTHLDLMNSVKKYLSQFIRNLKFEIYNLPSDLPNNEPDFNQFFLNEIEPKLPNGGVFVTDYPAFLSPLAKVSEAINFSAHNHNAKSIGVSTAKIISPSIAERFELYLNGIEIANGCTENRDPVSIKNAFEQEKNYRLKNHLPLHPYSEKFISDCSKIPPCSGVGLGLNRLLYLINSQPL